MTYNMLQNTDEIEDSDVSDESEDDEDVIPESDVTTVLAETNLNVDTSGAMSCKRVLPRQGKSTRGDKVIGVPSGLASAPASIKKSRKERSWKDKENELLDVMCQSFKKDLEPKRKDEIDVFADNVACQLRRITNDAQRLTVQHEINNLLYRSQMTFLRSQLSPVMPSCSVTASGPSQQNQVDYPGSLPESSSFSNILQEANFTLYSN